MIIGIGHKKRVGKDTFGKFLHSILALDKPGKSIKRYGFADPVKAISYTYFKWAGLRTKEYYEENPKEVNIPLPAIGKTPREIWIEIGTPVFRTYRPTGWIDIAMHVDGDYRIICDLRFPNEADAILEKGGKLIRIDNPSVPKTDDIADCALDGYDKWTHIIVNDGTTKDLHNKAIEFAAKECK